MGAGEGVRSVLRAGAEAIAPLLFGWLSDTLAGAGHAGLRQATRFNRAVGRCRALALVAVHTYPHDVRMAPAAAEKVSSQT
jgi:hypothetical protein